MDRRNIPWKAEWKAAGLDPGPLTEDEQSLVPDLIEENRAFLENHPPEKHLRPGKPVGFTPALWALPLAAAAALLVVLTIPGVTPAGTPGTGLERIKGSNDPALMVYRQGKGGPEKLASGASVRAGDILQAAYQVSRPLQGILLSLDGGGNVTVHFAQEGRSLALVPGAERPLEFSYELDRAPRFEVFFLFTSDKAFELEPLRQILRQGSWEKLAPGSFGPGIGFTLLSLVKEAIR